nr:MAG TPA: hypothetical protein [Caudoviricetes sp.]
MKLRPRIRGINIIALYLYFGQPKNGGIFYVKI